MKRITFLWALLLVNITIFAQTTPCPDIQSHGFSPISSSGSNCTSKVFAYATGDIGADKSLNIKVYIGNATTGTLVANNCFVVPGNSPSTLYETSSFIAPCSATITYVLAASTNSTCGGQTCGTTITVDGGPLPIKLNSFYAKRNSSSVILSWKTESEINAKIFIIQRKKGNDFIDISPIAATNKSTGSFYSYVDRNVTTALSQYRLKMVDADDAYSYSEIRTVKGSAGSVSEFTIFPNPSSGNTKVEITDISEATDVQLIDQSGRILKVVSMNNRNTVDFSGLQNGMYLIRVISKTSGENVTKKLNVVN